MPQYYKTSLIVAFTFGILITLGFKDFYPDLQSRFSQWRRSRKLHLDDQDPATKRMRVYLRDDEANKGGDGGAQQSDRVGEEAVVEGEDADPPLRRDIKDGIEGTIGNTPLIRIKSLSAHLGVDILAKAEFLNGAGQSPKDRVALSIINRAEADGLLTPYSGDTIYEGTVGSTGISLATICRARGYKAHVCMPSDQSIEKRDLLRKLGAVVSLNEPVGIVDPNHYVNRARRLAEEHTRLGRDPMADVAEESGTDPEVDGEVEELGPDDVVSTGGLTHNRTTTPESQTTSPPISPSDITPTTSTNNHSPTSPTNTPSSTTSSKPYRSRGIFSNQFETPSNHLAHFSTTGPEILSQTGGCIDAFIAGAGTGGTISGVALFLKPRLPKCKVILADPQGSGLYNKVRHGVMFSDTEREGRRRRHQVDSVVEGIGCNRVTANFQEAYERGYIDGAVRVTDRQARRMSRWLVQRDGIFVGSSSAVNVFAACRVARDLVKEEDDKEGRGNDEERERKTVVTILCDSGMRHLSRFWADSEEDALMGNMTLDDVLKDDD